MSRLTLQGLLLSIILGVGLLGPAFSQQIADGSNALVLPSGTKIQMAVIRPVWAKTVKIGDPLYAQTIFPAGVGQSVDVPAGTYVQGQIDSVSKPTRKLKRAALRVQFDKLIYADGYTVPFNSAGANPVSDVDVQVAVANDLLLDNGAQVEMTLTSSLALDAGHVAASILLSKAPIPGSFRGATLCRFVPGSPGTPGSPDTVIPGTSGTPDTIIPGSNGSPDIVIPGIPATPGTVIPGAAGTPDSPAIPCPAPPLVISCVAEVNPAVSSSNKP